MVLDPVPQATPTEAPGKPTAGRAPSTRETALLLTLAAIQFTHAVDFMVMMPLGPQFMRLFGIGPQAFGLLVSVYTLAAAASGFMAAFWVDRMDRKRALLGLYAGFAIATALCAFAPDYPSLLAARFVSGAFGGVIGGLVFAAVADLVPWARRAKAMAVVSAAFSLSAVAGIPLSLWLAARLSWRAPFVGLALLSVAIGLAASRILPPMHAHVAAGAARGPWRQFRAIFGARNHLRAFAMMIALTFAGFSVIPFVAAYNVANVGVAEQDLAVIYFAGGLATLVSSQAVGWLADRYGKRRVFSMMALASDRPDTADHAPAAVAAPDGRRRGGVLLRVRDRKIRAGDGARHRQRLAAAARQLHEFQRVDPAAGLRHRFAVRRLDHRPRAGWRAHPLWRRGLDRGRGDVARGRAGAEGSHCRRR